LSLIVNNLKTVSIPQIVRFAHVQRVTDYTKTALKTPLFCDGDQ